MVYDSFVKLNIILAIPFLDVYTLILGPREILAYIYVPGDMYKNIHGSIICNNKNLKIFQISELWPIYTIMC